MPGNNNKQEETFAESNQMEEVEEMGAKESADEVDTAACLGELEKQNAQLAQQLLRLKADHENFRRRSREQREELVLKANEELLLDLLPVLDNFERALKSENCGESAQDPFIQGMKMVHQGLLTSLANHGLEKICAKGQAFNPVLHDAISMTGDGGEDLIVLEEVQTGYLLNGKVIRHSKVLVGQNEEEDECQK